MFEIISGVGENSTAPVGLTVDRLVTRVVFYPLTFLGVLFCVSKFSCSTIGQSILLRDDVSPMI